MITFLFLCVITVEGVKQSKVRLPGNLRRFWTHCRTTLSHEYGGAHTNRIRLRPLSTSKDMQMNFSV